MATLKERIPDETTLTLRCREELALVKETLLARTEESRTLVKQAKKNLWSFLTVIICLFLASIFLTETFDATWLIVFGIGLLASLLYLPSYMSNYSQAQMALAYQMNAFLMGVFVKILDFPFKLSPASVDTRELFLATELSAEPIDSFYCDETYTFNTKYPVIIKEIKTTRQERNGKSTRTVTVFQGTFIEVTLNKQLAGKTFISTEGDQMGMAHQSFWGKILGGNAIVETTLEWNEFENDLHVATNNGAEARYILTPNFMEDLHAWWLQNKENIRLVFKDNKMFMLLPDAQVKLGESTDKIDDEALLKYVLSVVRPLWRVGLLVEDLKL